MKRSGLRKGTLSLDWFVVSLKDRIEAILVLIFGQGDTIYKRRFLFFKRVLKIWEIMTDIAGITAGSSLDGFLFDTANNIFKFGSFLKIHDQHFLYNLTKLFTVPGLNLPNSWDVGIKIEFFGLVVVVVDGSQHAYFKNDHSKNENIWFFLLVVIEIIVFDQIDKLGGYVSNWLVSLVHKCQVVFGGVDQHYVGYFDYSGGVDEDLVGVQALVVEFVNIEGVQSVAAAVEDAPHLIFWKIFDGLTGLSFHDLFLDGFERIFNDDFDFEQGWAHIVFADSLVLYKFKEMFIFNLFALV